MDIRENVWAETVKRAQRHFFLSSASSDLSHFFSDGFPKLHLKDRLNTALNTKEQEVNGYSLGRISEDDYDLTTMT